jgi:hypothetical protein
MDSFKNGLGIGAAIIALAVPSYLVNLGITHEVYNRVNEVTTKQVMPAVRVSEPVNGN